MAIVLAAFTAARTDTIVVGLVVDPPTWTLAALAGVALAILGAPGASAGVAGKPSTARFQTPSRNIGCGYLPRSPAGPAVLRCDIRAGLRPEPRRNCMLDWTGVVVDATGKGRPTCAGDTIYSRTAPVLAYGRIWRRDGFTCISRRVGLVCSNAHGHGFFLARGRWRVF